MPGTKTMAQKRAYATTQFNILVGERGLSKKTASKLMRACGPALAIKTCDWTVSLLEQFKNIEMFCRERSSVSRLKENRDWAEETDITPEHVKEVTRDHLESLLRFLETESQTAVLYKHSLQAYSYPYRSYILSDKYLAAQLQKTKREVVMIPFPTDDHALLRKCVAGALELLPRLKIEC